MPRCERPAQPFVQPFVDALTATIPRSVRDGDEGELYRPRLVCGYAFGMFERKQPGYQAALAPLPIAVLHRCLGQELSGEAWRSLRPDEASIVGALMQWAFDAARYAAVTGAGVDALVPAMYRELAEALVATFGPDTDITHLLPPAQRHHAGRQPGAGVPPAADGVEGVEVADSTLVAMLGADEWTDQPTAVLPVLRIDGQLYAYRRGRRVDADQVRVNLLPDEDAEPVLRQTGGELRDTYRVFRLTDQVEATAAGHAWIGEPMFRFSRAHQGPGVAPDTHITMIADLVRDEARRGRVAEPELVAAETYRALRAADIADGRVPDAPGETPTRFHKPAWVGTGDRPPCPAQLTTGRVCGRPAAVAWSAHGLAWSCGYHWPTQMAEYRGAVVVWAWTDEKWVGEKDEELERLLQRGVRQFWAEAGIWGGGPRALTWLQATHTFAHALRTFNGNVRMAALVWSVQATNPGMSLSEATAVATAALDAAPADGVRLPTETLYNLGPRRRPGTSAAVPDVMLEQPTTGAGWLERGMHLYNAGARDAARDAWTIAVLDHNNGTAALNLSKLALEQGDRESAFAWVERGADLGCDRCMNAAGALLDTDGHTTEAARWYEKAAQLDNPTAMFNLGLLAARAHDLRTAKMWWERSAALGDPDAAENLDKIARDPQLRARAGG